MKRKTVVNKIVEDEMRAYKDFMKRYHGVPFFPAIDKSAASLGPFLRMARSHLQREMNFEAYCYLSLPSDSGNYKRKSDIMRCFLAIELKKLREAGIIEVGEAKRIKTLVKGDESSVDLAMVLINKFRNKRIRKERNANKRNGK